MFEKMAAGMALAAAVMVGVMVMPVDGHGPVVMAYAADVNNQNSQNIRGGYQERRWRRQDRRSGQQRG